VCVCVCADQVSLRQARLEDFLNRVVKQREGLPANKRRALDTFLDWPGSELLGKILHLVAMPLILAVAGSLAGESSFTLGHIGAFVVIMSSMLIHLLPWYLMNHFCNVGWLNRC
jgi:hypothetical protein